MLKLLEGPGDIRGLRNRQPGRGTSRRAPRNSRHRRGPPLGNDHTLTTESRGRPDHRPQVPGVGDVVKHHDHPLLLAVGDRANEVEHIGVLERRNLQPHPLVQPITSHAVELYAGHLNERNRPAVGQLHRLGKPIVIAGALRDIQGSGRHPGVQAFDHRVAAHHQLGAGAAVVPPLVAPLALQLALMGGMVHPILGLRRGPLAPKATATRPTRSLHGTLFIGFTDTGTIFRVSRHM